MKTTPRKPWYRRTLLSARWLHNWIGVFIGVVLVLWVVSGLILLMPYSETTGAGQGTGRPIDWSAVTVSPAQAAQAASASADGAKATSVSLQQLRDGMVYLVRVERGKRVLVDAATARPIEVTESLAVAIASDPMHGASVASVQRFDRRGGGYNGPAPAWRVVFSDAARTEASVNAATGDVQRSEHGDRVMRFWGHDAHVFAPLRAWPGGDESRKGALWVTSIVSLISIIFGYWLALPRRWRSRLV